MDATRCNVIYVDRIIRLDRVHHSGSGHNIQGQLTDHVSVAWESRILENNVRKLANVFGDVHLCSTGSACISRLFNLQDESMLDLKPTIVLIDTPYDERIPMEDQTRSRSPSPHSAPQTGVDEDPFSPSADDVYGLRLLQRIVSEAHLRNLSKLVVPVPVIDFPESRANTSYGSAALSPEIDGFLSIEPQPPRPDRPANRPLLKRCLTLGATDVLLSPIHSQCITGLEIHAYWAYKSAVRDQQVLSEFRRGRKRSWVGISDTRPYAYLRENMVATLMRRICQMDDAAELPVETVRLSVAARRKTVISKEIGNWHFSAHDLSDDELVEASALMFKHALSMPELARFRIATDQLICFLIACRAAYNAFVPYHNFRHVVDVLQATFNFLVKIGALPPYPVPSPYEKPATPLPTPKSPMASLIRPFEALTLLITAIGHDVGHPGVNNGFLIELNTPLAQLYNDRSVLESFHCAAYSQILRRYWSAAFSDTKMRNLMISSILATDMGLHFDYMKKLRVVQDKLAENPDELVLEEQVPLACALLVKCADISNVARRHDAAVQWMHILSDEFSRQSLMEAQLEIKSSLLSQPTKEPVTLFRSQLGFMNLFAIPLFQEVANVMPAMQYCVDELVVNKALFEKSIADELVKPTPELERGCPLRLNTDSSAPAAKRPGATSGQTATAIPTAQRPREYSAHADVSATPRLIGLDTLYKGANGANGLGLNFDSAAVYAASDPFNSIDSRSFTPTNQRVSEATDGSASLPSGGDWASQATSATTGKMPLSPSTQGTSVVSRDSLDRPSSVPAISISNTAADGLTKSLSGSRSATHLPIEDQSSMSSGGHSHGNGGSKLQPERGLKKKTSRFRLNALTFLRRHLNPSPPLPTSCPNSDRSDL
ncbi:3'5'-cyclic nucleotide phosphodiesterase [Grosmannia clavigera kw1407]|uniref:Phosphodiesterase n=1 Tax=Grosmannia clavigera (strain kw1407 / UAMH 11150) TaxID=655863 RepID=F0XPL6_GROCL|nr:3'5'-cyclic nucleotide phosphodiesterase [Grosmannia clavigera kw1407]EFX00291.1 3'5'-cyclic nucleotide phosphodiesterase [Grosmannia clavigera kw1407]